MDHFRNRTYGHASIWVGAIIVGVAAVLYAKLINLAQSFYFEVFEAHSLGITLLTPFLFIFATGLVKIFAPEAKGSGIPQVLEAIESTENPSVDLQHWSSPLVSLKTAFIKIISSTFGILAGASIGREGPTIQIAASVFAWIARITRKKIPNIYLESYLIAGAAAGVGAAFNTPLAGITFALEELSEGTFGPFKQKIMLAVIIAGVTAQALLGDYLYFGHPLFEKPNFWLLPQALLLGGISGIAGIIFAKILTSTRFSKPSPRWWPRAFICGVMCALIGLLTHGASAGSGYEITKETLSNASMENVNVFFPFWKLATTAFSYLSGMAGGIFSPSLSIGSAIGVSVAKMAHFSNFKACALMGMVAFFAGAVQAPLTAVIIVMEMTDEHILILPFMISAFLAQGLAKHFMPVPLYRLLAKRHAQG